jgi:hypothetical protein
MPRQGSENRNFFGIFINLLGLISAILYFSGWIYRLAYYQRFDINVTELNFSFESFLLIPVCTLFSDLLRIVLYNGPLNLILLAISIVLISFFFIVLVRHLVNSFINAGSSSKTINKIKNSWFIKETIYFYNLMFEYKVIQVTTTLFILFILFSFAWVKGFIDGSRDITDATSILPEVSMVSGSTLSSKNPDVIGNAELANKITQHKTSDAARKWRLLLRQDDWIYVVSTVQQGSNDTPKVMAVSKGEAGDKLLIFQP